MNRRGVVSGLLALGIAIVPLRVTAQATTRDKRFRIATLPDLSPQRRDQFLVAMRDLGWTERSDFLLVQSGLPSGAIFSDEAAKRVVASMPNLILVQSVAHALAAHRATKTIPIVMLYSGYPVEAGLTDSLARPSKNVTGNSVYAGTEIWSKMIQLLLEARPATRRVGVLWTYVPPAYPKEEIEPCYAELRSAERSLGVKVHIAEAAKSEQVPAALAQIHAEQPDALLLTSLLPVNGNVRSTIMHFAVERRLPTIADYPRAVELEPHPPLLSYAPKPLELVRSAAVYVDKILKGAKPGELPIERPAKFAMIVNLKTAKAIGLTIPSELLLRADEVIE
jgi:putative ABC transport system substrate-binding protein